MIDIKVSIPNESKELNFTNFLNPDDKRLSKVNFHINKSIEKADYWFVFEDLESENQKCKVPFENIVYLNTETSFKKNYYFENYIRRYIDQFGQVYSCYATDHTNTINTYPFLPWMINAKYGSSVFENSKLNYQTLKKNVINKKEIKLSVICSNKRNTENHILRIEFLNILKKYFGDEILWIGQGIKEIDTKSEIIFDSKNQDLVDFDQVGDPNFNSFLHFHTLIIDSNILFTASNNFSRRGFFFNDEFALITNEQSLLNEFSQYFELLYKRLH